MEWLGKPRRGSDVGTRGESDPTFYGTDRHLLASDILAKLGDESSVAGNPNFV